jgi:hypothetical protein
MRSFLLAALAAACVGLAFAATFFTSTPVTQSASQIAGSLPYCIQVADVDVDYRPARTLLDLSGLRMWARSGHHAILVVPDEGRIRLFHWSYRKRDFVAGVFDGSTEGYGPGLACAPEVNFAPGLPLLWPLPHDSMTVQFSDWEIYRLPTAYQFRWRTNTVSSRYMSVAASSPDFRPITTRWADLSPSERDANSISIEWNPEWLLSLMASKPDGQIVERTGKYGLQASKIIVRGKDGKEYETHQYAVHADAQGKGANTTLITCYPPSEPFPAQLYPKSCQHRFLNKGRHVYFRHRPDDVPNWQAMQKRVLELFASFAIQGADALTRE